MRTRNSFSLLLIVAAIAIVPATALAQIDKPVRGKKYPLADVHGPWMIMVASFNALPPEQRTEGMTPEQAADELVFELRSHKVPAYTFKFDDKIETVETVDRLGEAEKRYYKSQRGSVCVLAGNYRSVNPNDAPHLPAKYRNDPEIATKTLEWIKEFRPKFLSGGDADASGIVSLDNGGIFRVRPGEHGPRGPLAGAFFTTNPLRSADEIRAQSPERLTLLEKLNAGGDCSLYENKGKYTMIVASFYGQSLTLGGARRSSNLERFNEDFGSALTQASNDAWELAQYMRQLKIDAYVWHDEHKSIVTVGSYETTDDPRILQAAAKYSSKMQIHAETKQPVLTAEILTIPLKPTPSDPIRKKWIFDPKPQLMKVPTR